MFPRVSRYKRRRDVKEVDITEFRVVPLMGASRLVQSADVSYSSLQLSYTYTYTYIWVTVYILEETSTYRKSI